jgi:hypothetical protein
VSDARSALVDLLRQARELYAAEGSSQPLSEVLDEIDRKLGEILDPLAQAVPTETRPSARRRVTNPRSE